jgi:alkylated DNA nucleotide flippase Atl1
LTEGFDWSRVEAAIAAIPVGRWTSYGDLAEMGGTAAQAVGNFVADRGTGSNFHRVLSADSSVSPAFHWHDPGDDRNVQEVLTAEGVDFEDARASHAQRITSNELASLIDSANGDELPLEQESSVSP